MCAHKYFGSGPAPPASPSHKDLGFLREYLRSLEERVRRQLLQFVGGDVQPVELLQQGEGPLRDEV